MITYDDQLVQDGGGIFGWRKRGKVNPIDSLPPGHEFVGEKQIIYPDFSINNAINEINDISNTDDLLDKTNENNIVKIAVEIYEKVYKIMFIQNEIASDKTSEYVNTSMSLLDPEAPPVIEDKGIKNTNNNVQIQTIPQPKPGFVKKYSPFLRITKYMFYIAAIATTKILTEGGLSSFKYSSSEIVNTDLDSKALNNLFSLINLEKQIFFRIKIIT